MNTNGVGLGLVISKQIAKQFDGDVSVESKLGVGSSFTFSFKL
jgi:signal transduction histidine kinase